MKNIEKIDNTWYNHYVNTQLRNAERRENENENYYSNGKQ